MNELIKITETNGQRLVSARELQSFLGATERFLSWFERQLQYGFVENIDYVGCKVFNALANQELTDFSLTIDCAKEISMLQRTDKGKLARQYFIEMEKVAKKGLVQLPDFNNPAIAARAWADQYEKRDLAERKVIELTPKAEVFDKISNANNLLSMAKAAKLLGTGRKRLFILLRDKKILTMDNLPYQEYIDRGYFKVKVSPMQMGSHGEINYPQTFVTAKGLTWLGKGIVKLEKEKS
jgi:anti-repressor protein